MKVVIDIPEVPKNDHQRWVLANGTPYARGEWIDREVYDADRWKCSECGRTEQYKENFCPNCGSDNRPKGR